MLPLVLSIRILDIAIHIYYSTFYLAVSIAFIKNNEPEAYKSGLCSSELGYTREEKQ